MDDDKDYQAIDPNDIKAKCFQCKQVVSEFFSPRREDLPEELQSFAEKMYLCVSCIDKYFPKVKQYVISELDYSFEGYYEYCKTHPNFR